MSTHEPLQAAVAADAHQSHQQNAIVIELLHDDAQAPRRATEGSAGYDLFAYLAERTVDCSDGVRRWSIEAEAIHGEWRVVLTAGAMALIPLGFRARLPNGYEAQIRPRSGASFKKGIGIPNAPGTVDSDFPDEWRVIVRNTTAHPLEIAHGERIAHEHLAQVGQQLAQGRDGPRRLVARRLAELVRAPVERPVEREIPAEPQRLSRKLGRHPDIVRHRYRLRLGVCILCSVPHASRRVILGLVPRMHRAAVLPMKNGERERRTTHACNSGNDGWSGQARP